MSLMPPQDFLATCGANRRRRSGDAAVCGGAEDMGVFAPEGGPHGDDPVVRALDPADEEVGGSRMDSGVRGFISQAKLW